MTGGMLMRLMRWFSKRILGLTSEIPINARHFEKSIISSLDDDPATPNDFLLDTAISAVQEARRLSLNDLVDRMKKPPHYPNVWPGEHYKLLAGLVTVLRPKLVVEVGTYTGLSALTIFRHLPANGSLVTFDLQPWNQFSETVLCQEDFADSRLIQKLGDLGQQSTFNRHKDLLANAELIFLDGPKDSSFEQRFLDMLEQLPTAPNLVLMLDDIRVWNMLKIWRNICKPKLDLTSFGHWSGTGLIHFVHK